MFFDRSINASNLLSVKRRDLSLGIIRVNFHFLNLSHEVCDLIIKQNYSYLAIIIQYINHAHIIYNVLFMHAWEHNLISLCLLNNYNNVIIDPKWMCVALWFKAW